MRQTDAGGRYRPGVLRQPRIGAAALPVIGALSLITPPTDTPVSLTTVKAHCRVDGTADDALITGYLAAAVEYVENYVERQLMTATWALTLDSWWRGPYRIPRPPLQTLVVTYADANNVTRTLDAGSYVVSRSARLPATVEPVLWAPPWPVLSFTNPYPVTLTFVAGYASADLVPAALKQAILMLVAHWYENRAAVGVVSSEVQMAVAALCESWRWSYV